MKDWKNMGKFAIKLIEHSLDHRIADINYRDVVNERIIIMHLDHATELLMKAFLIKNDYLINEIDRNKVVKIKKNSKVKDILDAEKTIGFGQILKLVSAELNLNPKDKGLIEKFHNIRNEIQHRAINLPLKKGEEIENFAPVLYRLYKLMFPQDLSKIEGLLIEPE